MRFWQVIVSDPATGEVLVANRDGKPGFTRVQGTGGLYLSTYTSLNYGKSVQDIGGSNPAALRVHLDVPTTFYHLPGTANAHIAIDGIGIAELSQASNLQGLNITVSGGMARGLPLANPTQAGILVSGQVIQAYGIWTGNQMQLNIYVAILSSPSSNQTTANPSTLNTTPLPATIDTPANIIFQWQPGVPLLTPLTNTLRTAFPQYTIVGAVHEGLVWSGSAATGFFGTLNQLAEYVNQKSLSIISGYAPSVFTKSPPQYQGVCISVKNNVITIQDGTTLTTPRQIQFIDLIGQPTWSQSNQVQATCVMRGDISCGDYVTLPLPPGSTGYGLNTPKSASQYFNVQPGDQYSTIKSASIFSGTFLVVAVRHVGDSREPSGNSWITVLDLVLMAPPQGTASAVEVLPTLYKGRSISS